MIEYLGLIGIMFMGYFIGRIIEAWLIGSWNYPKKHYALPKLSDQAK